MNYIPVIIKKIMFTSFLSLCILASFSLPSYATHDRMSECKTSVETAEYFLNANPSAVVLATYTKAESEDWMARYNLAEPVTSFVVDTLVSYYKAGRPTVYMLGYHEDCLNFSITVSKLNWLSLDSIIKASNI